MRSISLGILRADTETSSFKCMFLGSGWAPRSPPHILATNRVIKNKPAPKRPGSSGWAVWDVRPQYVYGQNRPKPAPETYKSGLFKNLVGNLPPTYWRRIMSSNKPAIGYFHDSVIPPGIITHGVANFGSTRCSTLPCMRGTPRAATDHNWLWLRL